MHVWWAYSVTDTLGWVFKVFRRCNNSSYQLCWFISVFYISWFCNGWMLVGGWWSGLPLMKYNEWVQPSLHSESILLHILYPSLPMILRVFCSFQLFPPPCLSSFYVLPPLFSHYFGWFLSLFSFLWNSILHFIVPVVATIMTESGSEVIGHLIKLISCDVRLWLWNLLDPSNPLIFTLCMIYYSKQDWQFTVLMMLWHCRRFMPDVVAQIPKSANLIVGCQKGLR